MNTTGYVSLGSQTSRACSFPFDWNASHACNFHAKNHLKHLNLLMWYISESMHWKLQMVNEVYIAEFDHGNGTKGAKKTCIIRNFIQ